jgi:hypothetical protein
MRKYTDKFVMNRLAGRLHQAPCPFPGKYPLRLFVRLGEKVLYNGKFHAAIWRQFFNKPARRNLWYMLYDKAGPVLYGSNLLTPNMASSNLLYRYFATNWISGQILKTVIAQTVGSYRVYFDDSDSGMIDRPLDRPRYIRYVNTNIAHVRTV